MSYARQLIRHCAERYTDDGADIVTRYEWSRRGRVISRRNIDSRLRKLEREFPLHNVEVTVIRNVQAFTAYARYRTATAEREVYFVAYGDSLSTARDYAIDLLRRHRKAAKIDTLILRACDDAPVGTEPASLT